MEIVPQLIANSLIAGSIYAILTLGFNLIFSTAKFIDMGYGVLTAVGGYAVFFLVRSLGLPLPIAIPCAMGISALVSFGLYRSIYAPLRAKKASNTTLLIASLGVLTFIQALIAILFSSQFQTLSGFIGEGRTFEVFGGTMTSVQITAFVITAVLFLLLAVLLRKTLFGKAITAISDDEEVARMVGINTDKMVGIVFLIAGAIGGLGGIVVGFDTGIEPIMGLSLLLSAVIAAIIGGIGNLYGGFVGAFLLAFVENFGIWQIAGEWKNAIAFGLLIIFLIWRPKGLFPR